MMLSPHLRRGQLLLSQERYAEAEKEISQALATEPNDPLGLALLSECYLETDRRAEALPLAEQALAQEPNFPYLYHNLARVQFFNKKIEDCKETLNAGLRLDPNDADFFLLLSQIEYYLEDWEASLNAANNGLELNPESVPLINQRTQALVKLNRKQEAAATIDFALNRSPENAYAHANKGWVAIEQDDYETAVKHFQESLRLDPTNEYTRTGLKEAIKAKNIVYRYVLKYFLWMSKMQQKGRWYFIIGIYVLYRIILKTATAFPALATLLAPIIILYILMAFSSWIAMPVSNAFLRFHPLGKRALTKDEMLASNTIIVLFLGFLGSIISFYAMGHSFTIDSAGLYITEGGETLLFLSLVFIFMMIPAGGYFNAEVGTKGRMYLGIFIIALVLFALGAVFTQMSIFFSLFFIGILIFSLSANFIASQDAKRI